MLAVGLPVQREEVVPVEDHVGARVLGLGDGAADLGIVGVLRLQLDGDPDRVGHGSIMAHMEQTGPRAARCSRCGALRTLWVPEMLHTSRDLLILVEQSARSVAPSDG